jgi:hypothetical protein
MRAIDKQTFLAGLKCPTRAWFDRRNLQTAQLDEGDRFLAEQGREIGLLARRLFPLGTVVVPEEDQSHCEATAATIADPELPVLFEATFEAEPFVARADIIERKDGGWVVIEVKMSLSTTDRLDELTDDLGYTVAVAVKSGLRVVGAELLLLNPDFRVGMAVEDQFVRVDQSVQALSKASTFLKGFELLEQQTSSVVHPPGKLCSTCRDCEHFKARCVGKGVENPVFELPKLHASKLSRLQQIGVIEVRDVPDSFPLTPLQHRVRECVRSGLAEIDAGLTADLSVIEWPVHYLDFESVMTAVPLYPDVGPFAQLTTQYSVHVCSAPGEVSAHHEYLADPSTDCERELAERLCEALGGAGSIVVYSSFEKTRLNAMARRFPDLDDRMGAVTRRLFDLLPVLRRGYYHPGFRGRFSIKKVLPVLVPTMSYEGMAIGDGGAATAVFARAARGWLSAAELADMRRNLLQYCGQDTLAMVELHRRLLRPD